MAYWREEISTTYPAALEVWYNGSMKKYSIGSVLPNGAVIVDGPQHLQYDSGKKYVKWMVECPTCGDKTWKFSNTFSKLKFGCKYCYDESMKKYDGSSAITRAYISLVSNAKSRNIEVSISKNEFAEIASKNCYYCDEPPQEKRGAKEWNGTAKLQGIDRVDNEVGYTLENSVSCCLVCNGMKSDKTLEYFMDKIKSIYERHVA